MSQTSNCQLIIDNKILELSLNYDFKRLEIFKVSTNLVIDKLDTFNSALALDPFLIFVKFVYLTVNFNFKNSSSDLLIFNGAKLSKDFNFGSWKISFIRSFDNYSVTGYVFKIFDLFGYERQIITSHHSERGINQLLNYLQFISQFETWKEYDMHIELHKEYLINLENKIENIWNNFVLTKNSGRIVEFENIEKLLTEDKFYNGGYDSNHYAQNLNNKDYFFVKELISINGIIFRILNISRLKLANCGLIELDFVKSFKKYSDLSFNTRIRNKELKSILKEILIEDLKVMSKYFDLNLGENVTNSIISIFN